MKKHIYIIASTFTVLLLTFTSCIPDLFNDCEDDDTESISREITIFAQVKYNDNYIFDGDVEATIWKVTCSGRMYDHHTVKGKVSESGWITAGKYVYSLSNKQDKVHYRFTAWYTPASPANSSEQTKELKGSFSYSQIKADGNEYDEIEKTYYITIPVDHEGFP